VTRLIAVAALVCAAVLVIWRDQQLPPKPVIVASGATTPKGGTGFDFYVLALSWSPSYCEAEGSEANRQQCESERPYAFIVHGLWPQYEHGYPSDCPTNDPDVPNEIVRGLYDIMPSAGLIRHEWRRHGTCTGLSRKDYFATLRAARERVEIPPRFRRLDDYLTITPGEVEKAFIASNPSIRSDGIATDCNKHYLSEVRICMTKALDFRSCPEVDRDACRLPKPVMPPVR
jgi:ribonuclease T2